MERCRCPPVQSADDAGDRAADSRRRSASVSGVYEFSASRRASRAAGVWRRLRVAISGVPPSCAWRVDARVPQCMHAVLARMRRATSRVDAASALPCVATRSRASMQADAPRVGHAMPDLRDPTSGWTPRRRVPSLIHSARATGIRARLRKKRHLNTGRGPGADGFMRPRNARSAFQSRPDWVRVPAFAREAGCDANVLPRRLPGDGAGPRPPSTRSIQVLPELSLCPGLAGALFFARMVSVSRIAMLRRNRNAASPACDPCDWRDRGHIVASVPAFSRRPVRLGATRHARY